MKSPQSSLLPANGDDRWTLLSTLELIALVCSSLRLLGPYSYKLCSFLPLIGLLKIPLPDIRRTGHKV